MKLIVGLGNPGRSYSRHRHNIGFAVLEILGGRHGVEIRKRSFGALVGSGAIQGIAVILAKPETFMNLSGDAVSPLLNYYKLTPKDLIVVHDDLDIELGRMKIVESAGHGGHNGIRSIMDSLKVNDFVRVRVGIGRPPEGMEAANYVLSPFSEVEMKLAKKAAEESADAVEVVLAKGVAAAQQKFH